MSVPIGESSQFSGFGFPVSPETSMELNFYASELQDARERQLQNLGNIVGIRLTDLTERPYVMADYISAVYAIDSFGDPLITYESIADLCAIKEQANVLFGKYAPDKNTEKGRAYHRTLENVEWTELPIDFIGQDRSYIDAAREVARELSPHKARSVNMLRMASRIWLDSFSVYEQSRVQLAASSMFSRLMVNELMRIEAVCDGNGASPCEVYERRQRALESMSDYAFAAVPMSEYELKAFRSLL